MKDKEKKAVLNPLEWTQRAREMQDVTPEQEPNLILNIAQARVMHDLIAKQRLGEE